MSETDQWWATPVLDAWSDMDQYRATTDICYEQTQIALETGENTFDMYTTVTEGDMDVDVARDTELLASYRARAAETYRDAEHVLTHAARMETMADARTRYVQGIIDRNDIADKKPHAYRQERCKDILHEMEHDLHVIQVRTAQIADTTARIAFIQHQLASEQS